MSEKIIVWNVNTATHRKIFMPDFVGDEIRYQDSDFVVLTEFCKTKNCNDFIQKYFVENGFEYIISNNSQEHNDILLAWRKDKYDVIKEENRIISSTVIPNFAYVVLEDKNGVQLVLAGVRITIESYENRVKQLYFALTKLKDFSCVVLGGDFNCLRRKTPETVWNINVLSEISRDFGFELVTPKGQSIYAEKAYCESYEFAEDHFVVKGVKIVNEIYDRSFTDRNREVYIHGKDFSIYDFKLKRNTWSINVGSGVPDHAILCGNMYIDNESKPSDM